MYYNDTNNMTFRKRQYYRQLKDQWLPGVGLERKGRGNDGEREEEGDGEYGNSALAV